MESFPESFALFFNPHRSLGAYNDDVLTQDSSTITTQQRQAIADRRGDEALRTAINWDGKHGQWFWFSFCDTQQPDGTQFLGAAIFRGPDLLSALALSRISGCNPGGEVAILEIPESTAALFGQLDAGFFRRLLSRDECERFDEALCAALEVPADTRG